MKQASLCGRLFSFSLLQLWFSVPRNPYQYCWLSTRSSSEKPHEEFIEHPHMWLHMLSWSLQFCSSLPSYSQASTTFWSALLQYQMPSSFWCLSTFWLSMPPTHMLLLWVLLYRMLPQAWQLCLLRLPTSSSFQASSFPGQNRIPLYDPSNHLYYDLPLFSIPWISNAVWYSEFSEATFPQYFQTKEREMDACRSLIITILSLWMKMIWELRSKMEEKTHTEGFLVSSWFGCIGWQDTDPKILDMVTLLVLVQVPIWALLEKRVPQSTTCELGHCTDPKWLTIHQLTRCAWFHVSWTCACMAQRCCDDWIRCWVSCPVLSEFVHDQEVTCIVEQPIYLNSSSKP